MLGPTMDEQVQAKHTRQQQLREYLEMQLRHKASAEEQRRKHAESYAQQQEESFVAWKAAQAEEAASKAARMAQYSEDLTQQIAEDQARKAWTKQQSRRGLETVTYSTGRHGEPVGTIRSHTGQVVPYILEEAPVLGTLGTAIKFAVVSAEDGSRVRYEKIPFDKFTFTKTK